MEVFTPARRNGLGVVWVVSSSGRSSRDQTIAPSFEQRLLPLLDHGYTVFAAIHGSAPAFNMQDFIGDIRRAVRFVRHEARDVGIDGDRLAIAGSSSGAAIALAVALDGDDGDPAAADPVDRRGSRLQAAGVFFAPTDWLHFGDESHTIFDVLRDRGGADPSFQFYEADPATGARTVMTDHTQLMRILTEISPASHVTSDDPPTMLIHGTSDRAVPFQQSQRLADALRAAHVDVRLVVRDGMGHAWPGWEADSELIAQWFDSHLRPDAGR
jgi:acetyl esterase/lipase